MTTKGNAYCRLEMKNTIKDIIGKIDKIWICTVDFYPENF